MYIKITKDHPSGFKKGQIIEVNDNVGERLKEGGYGSVSEKKAFDKYVLDSTFEKRKLNLDEFKIRVEKEIKVKQEAIDILSKQHAEEVKRLDAEIKAKKDKMAEALKVKKEALAAYKSVSEKNIESEEKALGINKTK